MYKSLRIYDDGEISEYLYTANICTITVLQSQRRKECLIIGMSSEDSDLQSMRMYSRKWAFTFDAFFFSGCDSLMWHVCPITYKRILDISALEGY